MSDLPTPAAVPAGHVVRVHCGGKSWASGIMPPSSAEDLADALEDHRAARVRTSESVLFDTADGRLVRIVARSISAIEVGPPPPKRDERRPEVVNVFLDGGSINAADLLSFVNRAEFLAGPA